MAIAKMSHLRLIALRSEENRIIDTLTEKGLFEARVTDEIAGRKLDRGEARDFSELRLKQSRISFALDFIKKRHDAMKVRLEENEKELKADPAAQKLDYTLSDRKFKKIKRAITHADFSDVAAKEYDLMSVCDALQNVSFEMAEYAARNKELASLIAAYKPFVAFPLKLSVLARTGEIRVALFISNAPVDRDAELKELRVAYEPLSPVSGAAYVVVFSADKEDALVKSMSAAGFTRCEFTDDRTARGMTESFEAEMRDIKRAVFELDKKALEYEKYYDELCVLYDVFELDIERAEADAGFLMTESTFVLEGWIPESQAEAVVSELKEKHKKIFVQLLAPEEIDAPPTLVVNKDIVKPYEDITNMYTVPRYREIDPNPVMSVFYFIFFGIMVGDAAYGLILAAAGLALGYSNKFTGATKRLILLIGWGGVSSLIWGIVFGGYFGIDFGENDPALWFNPMNDPMTMLYLSVVLGCVQLMTGYVMQFIKLCREGKPLDALLDAGPIIILFAALGCLGLSIAIDDAPKGLTVAAIVLACIAVAVMIIFGGRKNKNVFGKVFGGLKGLYGLVNLLSDVLSYCRLFGLCLASCAIALAFNTLGGIIFGIPVVGYPIGIIILIPLHAFNLALGVLSAYVHDARLQFLEFYGKFYDGEGRLFKPLGQRCKYVTVKNV